MRLRAEASEVIGPAVEQCHQDITVCHRWHIQQHRRLTKVEHGAGIQGVYIRSDHRSEIRVRNIIDMAEGVDVCTVVTIPVSANKGITGFIHQHDGETIDVAFGGNLGNIRPEQTAVSGRQQQWGQEAEQYRNAHITDTAFNG